MRTNSFKARGESRGFACAIALAAALSAPAQIVTNPVMFVTQVPVQETMGTVTSVGGNHLATTAAAPRGGDLMIRYPNGSVKNLTRLARYGEPGPEQGDSAIAVRDPCLHWSGERAIFSMVIGTAATARWQMYEVTGLGQSDSPVITKVLGQLPSPPAAPASPTTSFNPIVHYNNVQPCYASDDKIIFVSDRPRQGGAHLFPALDEKGEGQINTGLWQLDPATGALTQLEHSPSGSFDPFVDSYGRIVFSRWDHLQRDESGTAGRFDFSSEALNATGVAGVWSESFPEPLPTLAYPFGLQFDQFLPWTLEQDGTGLVTINHFGRHELAPEFKASRADLNLEDFVPPKGAVRAGSFLQIRQDPGSTAGRYVATDALFTAVSAGKLLSFLAPPTRRPEEGASMVTLTATGLARDPAILKNGRLMASVSRVNVTLGPGSYGVRPATPEPLPRTMIPSVSVPFKLVVTPGPVPAAGPPGMNFVLLPSLGSLAQLIPDIPRTVTNTVGFEQQTFSGPLWELQGVEVTAAMRPPVSTTPMDAPELDVFYRAGVSPAALRSWMTANDLAVISCRNVTTRDATDKQQPTNLRVDGGVETLERGDGPVYTIGAMQFFQADYVRGYGLSLTDSAPDAGRRVAARPMHDDKGATTTTTQGRVNVSTDGSMATFVPARRGLSWQLEDPEGKPIVRERYWLSFQAGEIRSCTSCHGVNSTDQAGRPVSTNPPQALRELLDSWKQTHPEAAAGSFRIWSEGLFGRTLDPEADTDGDGASNLEEFATGSSPLARPTGDASANPLGVTRQTVDGQELNTLVFTRSTTAYGLAVSVEFSDDMAAWAEAAAFEGDTRRHAAGFSLRSTPIGSAQEGIVLTDSITSTTRRRFYRLRIQVP